MQDVLVRLIRILVEADDILQLGQEHFDGYITYNIAKMQ